MVIRVPPHAAPLLTSCVIAVSWAQADEMRAMLDQLMGKVTRGTIPSGREAPLLHELPPPPAAAAATAAAAAHCRLRPAPIAPLQDRNVPLDQRVVRQTKFDDADVCKHALAGLCPFGERGAGFACGCRLPTLFASLCSLEQRRRKGYELAPRMLSEMPA